MTIAELKKLIDSLDISPSTKVKFQLSSGKYVDIGKSIGFSIVDGELMMHIKEA